MYEMKEWSCLITYERISQDLSDLLMKSNLINLDTYDYDELEAILFELTIEWRLENNNS